MSKISLGSARYRSNMKNFRRFRACFRSPTKREKISPIVQARCWLKSMNLFKPGQATSYNAFVILTSD